MNASASLSGGPAKKEKRKRSEKRKKKQKVINFSCHFSVIFLSFLDVSSLKTRYRLFLFAGLFIFFFRIFGDDRSPASSVIGTTQCGEYGCKGQNSGVGVRLAFFKNINHVKVDDQNFSILMIDAPLELGLIILLVLYAFLLHFYCDRVM
jgi:hypothetical protein